jgi:hypothetical protein
MLREECEVNPYKGDSEMDLSVYFVIAIPCKLSESIIEPCEHTKYRP